MSRSSRGFWFLVLGFWSGLTAACFGVPQLGGPFRCADDTGCAEGMICDDGVCCRLSEFPLCISAALPDGGCSDGGSARAFAADNDRDGFGKATEVKYFCAAPLSGAYVADVTDCNDSLASGGASDFPGAPELCDARDNDCDGVADEGLPGTQAYYVDLDNDGFGAEDAGEVMLCKSRPGYVTAGGDCGPTEPSISPAALEICNTLDDDCDGPADEGVTQTYYRDDDGDGYGTGAPVQACARPANHADVAGDCKDDAGNVYPGRQDICDGLDNNCVAGADERPDCGGPQNLLTAVGATRGADRLDASYNGVTTSCVRDGPKLGPDAVIGGDRWLGSGAGSHVFWVETPVGWDLSLPGKRIRLHFHQSLTSDAGPASWSNHRQPVVLLCSGGGGYHRYVTQAAGTNPLMPVSGFDAGPQSIQIDGGSGWTLVNGGLNRRTVRRIEILIQPSAVDGGTPDFSLELQDLGFSP